jgi:hypothetical protein
VNFSNPINVLVSVLCLILVIVVLVWAIGKFV